MRSTGTTSPFDTLAGQQLLRVRQLEAEVALLRAQLASVAPAQRGPEWQQAVLQMLSKVVLFRVALGDGINQNTQENGDRP